MTEIRERELEEFAKKLGVAFNDLNNLDVALTHTSYAKEKGRNAAHNERMEFLGDAVLELATSEYLYKNFPLMPEGTLTKTRSGIVCSSSLAELATELGFGEMLLLGHGEEQCGGRTRISILEDAFEAVIGAIYVDRGWETAKDYVLRRLAKKFSGVKHGRSDTGDYKSLLQEFVQQKPSQQVEYELIREEGPDHAKTFEMAAVIDGRLFGKGVGHSKKEAQQNAAKAALAALHQ